MKMLTTRFLAVVLAASLLSCISQSDLSSRGSTVRADSTPQQEPEGVEHDSATEPAVAGETQVQTPEPQLSFDWPSKPPADCPFESLDDVVGVTFTGRHREYATADCWFPSWAADGNMYSPFSDGAVENVLPDGGRERIETFGMRGEKSNTGHGKIVGDDPMNLTVIGLGTFPAPPAPYDSSYPSGSLVHNGIWYYGSHPEGPGGLVHLDKDPYEWPWIGPFVGFRISHDP